MNAYAGLALALIVLALAGGATSTCVPTINCAHGAFQCDSSTCKCDYGWTAADCSQCILQTQCVHGTYDCTRSQCVCEPGWQGTNCSLCDASVSNTTHACGPHAFCESQIVAAPNTTTSLQCTMLDPSLAKMLSGGVVSLDCDLRAVNGSANCLVDVWHSPTGAPVIFSCALSGCSHRYDSDAFTSEFRCAASACSCGPVWRCSDELDNVIAGLVSGMTFVCGTNTGACTLYQDDLLLEAKLACVTGVCVADGFRVPPRNAWTRERLITSALIVGAVVTALAALVLVALVVARARAANALWRECAADFATGRTSASLGDDALASFGGLHGAAHESTLADGPGPTPYELRFVELGLAIGGRTVLADCSGCCKPGTVTAIMGASGAGKTTLLNLLAGRVTGGQMTGEVLLNGAPPSDAFARIAGYVQQEDFLVPTLTVRETLGYYAQLRLPQAMSAREKNMRVLGVLAALGLEHVADSRVGSREMRGISGGERRRVSIGCELVTAPRVLFLDEPTSGLDASTAHAIVRTLAALAVSQRLTVVLSIHQPRSSIFALFDSLVLLARGALVYNGRAADATAHFAALGHVCPHEFNPADYLIDMLADASADATRELAQRFRTSSAATEWTGEPIGGDTRHAMGNRRSGAGASSVLSPGASPGAGAAAAQLRARAVPRLSANVDDLDEIVRQAPGAPGAPGTPGTPGARGTARAAREWDVAPFSARGHASRDGAYATSFWHQFVTLSSRTALNVRRNPALGLAHIVVSIVVSLVIGAVYFHVNDQWSGLQNRAGCIFFVISLLAFGSLSSLELFIAERALFEHERANGCYRTSAYFAAKVLCDLMPLRVVPPLIVAAITYPMIGLKSGLLPVLWFNVVLVLVNLTAAGICMCVGVLAPSVGVANLLTVLVMLFFMLFGGFLVNNDSVSRVFVWFKALSFFGYAFEALMVSQLDGHMTELAVDSSTNVPISGAMALKTLSLSPDHFARDVLVLAAMSVGYLVLAYVLLRLRAAWLSGLGRRARAIVTTDGSAPGRAPTVARARQGLGAATDELLSFASLSDE